jgi:hypothetical protein
LDTSLQNQTRKTDNQGQPTEGAYQDTKAKTNKAKGTVVVGQCHKAWQSDVV